MLVVIGIFVAFAAVAYFWLRNNNKKLNNTPGTAGGGTPDPNNPPSDGPVSIWSDNEVNSEGDF